MTRPLMPLLLLLALARATSEATGQQEARPTLDFDTLYVRDDAAEAALAESMGPLDGRGLEVIRLPELPADVLALLVARQVVTDRLGEVLAFLVGGPPPLWLEMAVRPIRSVPLTN